MNKTKLSIILVAILILVNLINFPLKPENNFKTTNTTIQFQKTGNAQIIIDNNKYFTSPTILNKPYTTTLEPDTYYWKSKGITKTNTFTIESEVTINLLKKQDQYTVQNKGNTPINIVVRNLKDWLITGFTVLEINQEQSLDIKNESVVIASQK